MPNLTIVLGLFFPLHLGGMPWFEQHIRIEYEICLCYNFPMQPVSEINRDMLRKITLVIADDHAIIREAIRNLLEKENDIDIVAEAADGEEAVNLTCQKRPDIVIMDISMPKLNGMEATRLIKVKCPNTAILALTVHDDSESILGILEAGAAGYLTKSIFGYDVIQAVRSVAAGESVLSNTVLQQVLKHALRSDMKAYPEPKRNKLTGKELLILQLAAKGLSNKEIGQKIKISPLTVKGYLMEIFSKLEVSSRTEAVIKALQSGYFTLRELN
jgi:two-component system, NarL family, response regulator LiaR